MKLRILLFIILCHSLFNGSFESKSTIFKFRMNKDLNKNPRVVYDPFIKQPMIKFKEKNDEKNSSDKDIVNGLLTGAGNVVYSAKNFIGNLFSSNDDKKKPESNQEKQNNVNDSSAMKIKTYIVKESDKPEEKIKILSNELKITSNEMIALENDKVVKKINFSEY